MAAMEKQNHLSGHSGKSDSAGFKLKDRKLGDEWADWDGTAVGGETVCDEDRRVFIGFAFLCLVAMILSSFFIFYMIYPRLAGWNHILARGLMVVLILASLATIWEGWRLEKSVLAELPAGEDRKRVLSLLGLLLGYFIALPWLGQILSSTVFCILLVRVLSDLRWPRIVVYSLVMSIALYVVFVFLLKVPMPRGILVFYN
jgi:hypothetical protein